MADRYAAFIKPAGASEAKARCVRVQWQFRDLSGGTYSFLASHYMQEEWETA